MKKIKNIIKSKDLDVLLLILVLVSAESLLVLLNSTDELWNFANAYKMFNGYKIYKELNVIITPLFFYIAQMLFKLFGATMLTFRIYNILIFSSLFILIYSIFRELKIVRRRSVLYIIIIMLIFNGIIEVGANYNILALIPILINIFLALKGKNNYIITGTLLFLTFLLKQNIFVFFAISILIYEFITKESIRKSIINIIKIYFISFIGITLFLVYMYLDNNLHNFIDYCFLGISEFGIKNKAFIIYGARYSVISIGIIIFILLVMNNKKVKKNINNEVVNNIKILLCFGVPLLLIQYPIANYYHSTVASLIVIINFIYIIEKILIEQLDINITKEKKFYIVLIIIYFLYFINISINLMFKVNNGNITVFDEGAYYGILVYKKDKENIQIISNYIKEQDKNVIVFSHKANLYNVILNKNNGDFDLYFLGNLGKEGEKGLINKIKKLKNTILLIEEDDKNFIGQEPINARQYVVDNYQNIGNILEYSIYFVQN